MSLLPTRIQSLGMELDAWLHKSCTAQVGTGDKWATIYSIESTEPGKGHGRELILAMQKYYESQGKTFGSSIALSTSMRHLIKKLGIKEYRE